MGVGAPAYRRHIPGRDASQERVAAHQDMPDVWSTPEGGREATKMGQGSGWPQEHPRRYSRHTSPHPGTRGCPAAAGRRRRFSTGTDRRGTLRGGCGAGSQPRAWPPSRRSIGRARPHYHHLGTGPDAVAPSGGTGYQGGGIPVEPNLAGDPIKWTGYIRTCDQITGTPAGGIGWTRMI